MNAENFPPKSKSDNDDIVVQQGSDAKGNQDCTCKHEIDRLLERIKSLEEQRRIENFGINRFMLSDSDISFYTGLPDSKTFLALFDFLKPRMGFHLNYYNGYTNVTKHPSYVVSRGRPRNLAEIDELFLTMNRLRLGLLEKDLADRFNIDQTEVSKIFSTWVDRMHDCLGQLSFLTDRETMKKFLPNCLSQSMKMFILLLTALNSLLRSPHKLFSRAQHGRSIKAIILVKLYLACPQLCFQHLFLRCNLEAYQMKRFYVKVVFWHWPKEGTDGWQTRDLLCNISWMIME